MTNLKRITAAVALLLASAALVPVAYTADEEAVRSSGGISYVSGGVGAASTDRLSALAKDFNLKLVFALKSGDYVSGVDVTIADAVGKTLLKAKSEGPWFLTRLPAGNFKIAATLDGKTETRTVAVGAEKLRTVDFRWAGE
ncbi:MAG TPA: carboxypeptidase regulatory-like domain-containing protein [Burkholderiales bacterium]|nr:carboxypeptidase regulatory-like domain-containing protein [Burkholderiales bacterium]